MIVTDDGSQLFVGDIVEVLNDKMLHVYSHAKVIKFMTKVKKKGNLAESERKGKLVAEVKPIMVRHGIHVLLTAQATISCKHIQKTTLPFTKHNTVVTFYQLLNW